MPGLQQHQLSEQHAASTRGGQEQDRCIDLTGDSDSDADRRVVSNPRLKQQQQRADHQDAIVIDDADDDDVIIMDSMPGRQHSLGRKAQLGSAGQHSGAQGSQSCKAAAAAALTGGSPPMGTAAASQGQLPQNISGPVGAAPADGSEQPAKKLRLDVTGGQELPEPQQQQQQQLPHQPSAPSSGSQPISGQALSRQQRLTQALSLSRARSAGMNGTASTAATNAQPQTVDAAAAPESNLQAQAAATRPAAKQGRRQAASRLGASPMPPVLLPPAQHPVPKQPAASAPVWPAAAAMPAIRTHITPAAAAPTALTPAPEQPELQQPAAKVSKISPEWSDSRRAASLPARAEAPLQPPSNNEGAGSDAGG